MHVHMHPRPSGGAHESQRSCPHAGGAYAPHRAGANQRDEQRALIVVAALVLVVVDTDVCDLADVGCERRTTWCCLNVNFSTRGDKQGVIAVFLAFLKGERLFLKP